MAKSPTLEQTISEAELAHLLAHFRLRLPAGSPLAPAIQPTDGATYRLKQRNLLSMEWGEALRIVTGERAALKTQDVALDAVDIGEFLAPNSGKSADGGCFVRKTSAGQYHFAYPLAASQLLLRLGATIDPITAAPPLPLDRHLSAAGLTAFGAAIDFLRTLFAASLVQRQGLDCVFLRQRDLEEQIITAIDRNDNRALVRLFRALLPSWVPCAPGEICAGASELVDAGLLSPVGKQDDLWAPQPDLMSAAFDLLSPLPAISLARAVAPSRRAKAGAEPSQLIFLRGNSLWQLDVPQGSDDPAQRLRLRSVDGLACLMTLNAFLAAATGAGADASKAAKPRKRPSRRPAQPPPAATGAALPGTCAHCGAERKPGKKFCTQCGAPVSAPRR